MDLPSLRPYLDPGKNNCYLKFSLTGEDESILKKAPFPFMVISDSDPLTRLIEAQFITDTKSEIKKVFLLIQKDQYLLAKDELWPIKNKDIDESWQRTFSFFMNKSHHASFITLSRQIGPSGDLRPFQSLFFCKKAQAFFHPPCPECGLPIQLCDNDEWLASSGLQIYSTSLRRYLYCPSCFASKGHSDFYVYELENTDPPILKNRWDLLKAFGTLIKKKVQTEEFPCLECPYNKECYGPHDEVISRIAPFFFYPSFMLIFEAMSLNAADFLSLLSGASSEELESQLYGKQEPGRAQCLKRIKQNRSGRGLLFRENDENYFLEVLYLKLAFLGDLIQDIFSPGQDIFKHPEMRISLDRIWVKLTDQNDLLPFFWNFDIRLLDILKNPSGHTIFPKLPSSYGLYFMGLLWFYTLLVNKKQPVEKVYDALGETIQTSDTSVQSPFTQISLIKKDLLPTFFPENIFWDPENKGVNENWRPLWVRSLSLGWSLFESALDEKNSHWSKEKFLQELESLQEEVKKNLFEGKPFQEEQAYSLEDVAIHDILVKIHERWLAKAGPPPQEAKIRKKDEKEIEETVILPDSQKEFVSADSKIDYTEQEELEQTVVISPSAAQAKPASPPKKEETQQEQLEQTVVISPSTAQAKPASPLKKEDTQQEQLEQTVVISPSAAHTKPASPLKTKGPQKQEYSKPPTESPMEKKGHPEEERPFKEAEDSKETQKPLSRPPEDDFFTETVILTPDNNDDTDNSKDNE